MADFLGNEDTASFSAPESYYSSTVEDSSSAFADSNWQTDEAKSSERLLMIEKLLALDDEGAAQQLNSEQTEYDGYADDDDHKTIDDAQMEKDDGPGPDENDDENKDEDGDNDENNVEDEVLNIDGDDVDFAGLMKCMYVFLLKGPSHQIRFPENVIRGYTMLEFLKNLKIILEFLTTFKIIKQPTLNK